MSGTGSNSCSASAPSSCAAGAGSGNVSSTSGTEGTGLTAVSYTHLDVYKRQEQQNIFYRNLRDAGVRFVITGHLHAHDLYMITSPDGKNTLTSLIRCV